jgi:hypothetical protein
VIGLPKAKRDTAPPRHSIPVAFEKTSATAEGRSKKRHSYRPLPTRFRRDGFDFRQIARQGDAAIYAQVWNVCSDPAVCFEVVRIKRRQGVEIKGKFIGPREVYPNSEAWGADSFTFADKDVAFAKLRALRSGR